MNTYFSSLVSALFGTKSGTATTRRRTPNPTRFATVEGLESRQLLSAAPVDNNIQAILHEAPAHRSALVSHGRAGSEARSLVEFVDPDATRGGATNFNTPGFGYTAGGGVENRNGVLSNDHPQGPFGPDDRIDYWKFTLNKKNGVNISISGLRADLDLYLEDSNGRVINSSTLGGTSTDSLSQLLSEGTYYIRIQRYSSTGSTYNLRLELGQDTRTSAIYLGTNPGGVSSAPFTTTQTVGNGDTVDFYKFDVSDRRGIKATLSGLSVDVDIEVQDINGNVIKRSSLGGTSTETLRVNLNRGTYFLRVYRFSSVSGETAYNLKLEATPGVYTDLP